MIIREIRIDDANSFTTLIKEVESNANFMLMEDGERKTTPKQQVNLLNRFEKQSNSTIFVAEDNEKLIGYLIAIGGTAKRTKHTAQLVIGILKEYQGMGTGTKLFNFVTQWAEQQSLSRLELTVVKDNKAGVELYKKCGFEIEGTKRNSLIINDESFDEFYMSKLI